MPEDRLHYEEIADGLTWETGGITVTESHILAFAGLSGDFYDLHVDDDYARALGFPGKVAHGLLGLALADGLKNRSSVRLAAVVSLGWRWNFTGPILPGDRISAVIRVIARRPTRRPERGIVTLEFDLRNQRGGDGAAGGERHDGALAERLNGARRAAFPPLRAV